MRHTSYFEGFESQTIPTLTVSPPLDIYLPQHILDIEDSHAKALTFLVFAFLLLFIVFIFQYIALRHR